jgi:hypothetical protein
MKERSEEFWEIYSILRTYITAAVGSEFQPASVLVFLPFSLMYSILVLEYSHQIL